MKTRIEMHAPVVGMRSLIGLPRGREFPVSFGNYCSIERGPYLCNIWAENLSEWADRNPDVGAIEITIFEDGEGSLGFVSDSRLSKWVNPKPCVTGHGWPSAAVAREVCARMGAPVLSEICGCEAESQRPRISYLWQSGVTMCRCNRCGRTWEL